MPPTTGTTEEIIEKKDSSPLGTSCLVLSALALLGAIILQLIQISRLQEDLSASQIETIGTTGDRYLRTVVQPALDLQAQDVQKTIDEAKAQVSPEDKAEWQSIAEGNLPAGAGAPGGLPAGTTPGGIEIDPGALEPEGLDEGADLGDFDTP